MHSHALSDRTALDTRAKRLGAALISGVMLSMAGSLQPWWLIAWIAPIPLLLAAFSAARGETLMLAAVAALIGSISITSYYLEVAGPPATIVITTLRVDHRRRRSRRGSQMGPLVLDLRLSCIGGRS
jgi:hypothetical protein